MATDVVSLWNLAVSAAGGRGSISAEDENSREANLCRLWYEPVRDNVLKSASWPCTKKYESLAVLATRADFNATWTNTDPAPGWAYAYGVPNDMLAPRYLTTYAPFERALYGDVNSIVTNQPLAVLHYTMKQTDVTRWDAGLDAAVRYTLAANLSMPLSGKSTRTRELRDLAFNTVREARTDMANESDQFSDAAPVWIGERGYSGPTSPTRFFYPYENLNAVAT